jgi:hypothetical protein
MGCEIIVFKNVVAIRVNRDLEGLEEITYI